MRAAFTQEYGSASVIRVRETPEPALGRGQVRVRVFASPVTAGDLRLRMADCPGVLGLVGRIMFGVTRPRVPVQGTMFSGRVVEVGEGVTRFSVGDAVFGDAGAGAWAELLVVDAEGAIARRPVGVSDEAAAAAPYGAGTALTFLVDLARVQPGQRVLVVGGSGGVGRFAIQIAKALGAHVTAVGSAKSHDLMRRLGADAVIDHRTQDFTALDERWDVVFDVAGVSSLRACRPVLTEHGRFLTLHISFTVLWQSLTAGLFGGPRVGFTVAMGDRASAERLVDWLERGAIAPVIAGRYPLERIVEAHRAAEADPHGSSIVAPRPGVDVPSRAAG